MMNKKMIALLLAAVTASVASAHYNEGFYYDSDYRRPMYEENVVVDRPVYRPGRVVRGTERVAEGAVVGTGRVAEDTVEGAGRVAHDAMPWNWGRK